MSVTLTITHNHEFCEKKNKRHQEVYPCECPQFNSNIPDKDCPECHGTGKVKFEFDMFELNICHGTLITIVGIIGLDKKIFEEYNGEFNPIEFLIELNGKGIDKFVYDFCVLRCCDVKYGVAIWHQLQEICCEATRRNEKLCWG
jgi:hypothetical protein